MMTCEDFKWTEQMWQDFATMFIHESDQLVIVKVVPFTACTM